MVKALQTMRAVRPDVIRATRAHTMLRCFGRGFRGNVNGLHKVSFATEKIEEFWSHSWHTSAWMKVFALWFVNNGHAAGVLGMLSALVACILCLLEVLPLDVGQGVKYPWCALFGTLGYYLTLLQWRRRKKVFVDVVCIDQADDEFKALALISIPAILQRSEGMLVMWDPTWANRLWCVFELAAFLHSRPANEKVRLLIRPTVLGPVLLAISLGLTVATLAFSSNFAEDHVIYWPRTLGIVMIVSSSCLLVSTHLLRLFCRSIDTLQKQLENFHIEDTHCTCCDCDHIESGTGRPLLCDRKILHEVIISWFGSIEKFEREVRGRVRTTLLRQIFSVGFVYSHFCAVASCVSWYFMDLVVWEVINGEVFNGNAALTKVVLAGLRALVWWLALEPTVLIHGLALCWLLRNRYSQYLAIELLVTSSSMIIPSFVLIGLVLLEVLLDPGTSVPGAVVFAAVMAGVVTVSWCFACRCFPR
ncbi:unnamed protein product [Symbiodinium natans]|uniref:Transmembrane protein n=1 Tax=Symbiodinium natans TaxID=878477 RepID=A0A812LY93_9DINO|nr:unnamed protein product [Symbiodinium natans]